MSPGTDLIGRAGRRLVRAAALTALAVTATTCKVGELISPSPPGALAVSPGFARDSAAVGSRPVRLVKIGLRSTGPGTIDWTAALARGSAWIRIGATTGSTPDSLALSLDPAGLFVGDYHDTVQVAPADGSGEPTAIPVTFSVQPCRERSLAVGGTVSDSIVEADCEAPHRADRFAKVYKFSAQTAGDSVTVVVRSTAFDPYVLLDSATAGSLAPLAEADRCGTDADAACVRYALLPRAGDFYVEVTSGGAGEGTGPFTLEIQAPRPPGVPTGLGQLAGDSVTPIVAGGTISDSGFVVRGTGSDPDLADSLALEVEVQPVGTPFTGTPTVSGALGVAGPLVVRVPGLSDNMGYHWQVRTRDETGRTSAWVAFGTGGADLLVAVSEIPEVPTGLGQFRSDAATAIAAGATTNEGTVVLKGTVTDPDPGDQVRLEAEVQPFGAAFTGVPTAAGVLVARGAVASVTVTGLTDGVSYHWRVRTVDQTARPSDWVAFAGAGTTPDFSVDLPAALLAFGSPPTAVIAGSAISPAVTVEARKGSGVVDTAFQGTVDVVIAPGTGTAGAALGGTASVTAVRGVATFSTLSVNLAGTGYRLLASSSGLGSATSDAFAVTASAATKLALATAPSASAQSGIPFTTQPVVQLQDASGNPVAQTGVEVIVSIASGPAGATPTGASVLTDATGAAVFTGLAITGPTGNYTLRFAAAGLTAVLSGTINLIPGTADPTRTTATVPGGTAGQPTSIVVSVRDGAGNRLTTGGDAVAVSVTGANTATPAVTDNGDGTYQASYTPTTAGSDAVAITLNGTAISGSPYTSTVAPAGGATLAFVASPTGAVAGANFSPPVQVAVRDANGNTVTSSTAAVTIGIGTNPGGGTLSGSLTVNAVAGVATFSNLSIDKVGAGYTLAASASGLTGATSPAFNVTPGPAARLAFTGQPSTTVAGAAILPPVTVTVQDANGNTVTSSSASVTVGLGTNPVGGALSGTLTVAAANGVATFGDLSIDRAGTGYTLTAAATGLISATSAAFNVDVGSGNQLAFIVQPPMSGTAGSALTPAVQVAVEDAIGNTVTSSTAAITVALGTFPPGGNNLQGTLTVNAVNGVATFSNLRLDVAGSGYTLVATGPGGSGLAGATSGAFNIAPAAASQLAFSVQPSNVVAGAAISPAVAVRIQDPYGNTVTTSSAAVNVALGSPNPGGGTLTGATTVTAANGVATFSPLSIDKAGNGYTLVASSSGLTGATSNGFNVMPGAATKLGFLVQPTNTQAGASIAPAVQVAVQDANGNTVTTSTASVVVVAGGGPGALNGATTVAAVNGVATFADLSIDSAATGYTLAATSAGLTDAGSAAFDIVPGPPAALGFAVEPASTVAGELILPPVQVAIRDALGNTVTSSTAQVTVALGTNPNNNGTLSGTVTMDAVAGVATFGDLSIDAAESGYTLTASSGGLPDATSAPFNISVGSGNKLAWVVQPSNTIVGAAIAPAIQVAILDAADNTVTTATDAVTLVLNDNPGAASLSGTTTVNAVGGIATFSTVSLNRVATGYTMNAIALGGGLSNSPKSTAFSITAGSTAIAITSHVPDPSVTGQAVAVSYSVTVTAGSGTPTGNVTVSDGTGATCVAPVSAGGCLLTPTTAGAKTLTATYAGDGNFQGSTSAGVGHTVDQAATSIVIDSAEPNPSITGQPITVSYTVNVTAPGGGSPTGTVTVTAGADSCIGSPAAQSCQLTLTSAGAKSITATYSGDADYLGSGPSTSFAHQVNPAATTTEISSDLPDPSVTGQSVTVQVAVTAVSPGTGTPDGTVTVSGGAGVSCEATLAGGAGSCALVFPTAGSKSITATYAGSANYAASATAAPTAHVVSPAPTTTTITDDSPDPTTLGGVYTVSFTVSSTGGTPSGSVTVSDGTGETCVGTLTPGVGGSCELTSQTAGTKTLTASYAGDANFAASVSAGVTHTVQPAATTTSVASSLNPSVFGQEVTFTATVTTGVGTPVGTVQFSVDGGNLGSAVTLVGGQAVSPPTSALTVGTHPVTASYVSTDGNHAASAGALTGDQVVDQAATTTTIGTDTPDPSEVGEAVTVTYAVAVTAPGAGTPSGDVTVSDGAGTSCTDTVAAGACDLTFATIGARTLTATYAGDPSFAGSASAGVAHDVVAAATATAVTSSANPSVFGQPVSFTATVTSAGPTPTGSVQFVVDAVDFGAPVPLAGGVATTAATAALAVGAHTVTANYTPADGSFAASQGTLSGGQVVNQASTTTTITGDAPDPSTAGQEVVVTFTVTANAPGAGTPAGNVTVSSDAGPSCVGTVAVGSCSLTFTTAGNPTLTATYAGDGSFASSSDTEAHQVAAAVTTTTLTASPNPVTLGQTVTFTATVTSPAGTPPGNVRFRVDGADIPPAPFNVALVNGVATRTWTSSLPLGPRVVTVAYTSSSADFANSAGTLDGGQIVQAATTTGVTSSENPSASGQGVTFTATVTSGSGTPTGSVQFKVDGATLGAPAALTGGVATSPTTTTLAVGTRAITAEYGGAATFAPSVGGLNQVVTAFGNAANVEVSAGDGQSATAGTPVATPPAVLVTDAFANPVAGAEVTFAVESGGGSVDPTTPVLTDGTGIAAATSWTLGASAGANTLTATVTGTGIAGNPVTFTATGTVGAAAKLALTTPPSDQVVNGEPFPQQPVVQLQDASSNPVAQADVPVTVAIATGAGALAGTLTVNTDATGVAPFTDLVITGTVGDRTLEVTAGALTPATSGTITVNAGPADAGSSTASVPAGVAGSPTNIAITVLDASGNRVTGQAAALVVSVLGANAGTAVDLIAEAADTTYTTSYTPTAAGDDAVTITLNAVGINGSPYPRTVSAGAAAALSVIDGDSQTMLLGKAVNVAPRVLVEDAQGNPVPDATVDLAVTAGGGSVGGGTAVTDTAGIATVDGWTVGPAPGANQLRVAIPGDTITFAATGQAAAYTAEVRYFGDLPSSGQQTAFTSAAARWGQLVFGDVPDVPMNLPADWCATTGVPAISETIDDLVIYAQVTPIDGPGGILGQAGPCYVRTSGGLPILGIMQFDSDDVAGLESGGQLDLVILHEMGHVLGLGTLWDLTLSGTPVFDLLANPCPSAPAACNTDPHFTGARGTGAFDAVGGTDYSTGEKVPVENTGGDGTRNGHWRENVFGNELMTGFLNGGANPLSMVSVASFWDMAYLVVYADADSFAWSPAPPALVAGGIDLTNDILGKPIGVVGPGGQIERVIQPRPEG